MAVCVIACMLMAACADSIDVAVPDSGTVSGGKMVNLSFSVVAQSSTGSGVRARSAVVSAPDDDNYFEKPAFKYECLHTLRIIILRRDVTGVRYVEQNAYYSINEDGTVRYGVMELPVRGGENKTVYLIANESGIDYDFSRYEVGDIYTAGSIENITYGSGSDESVILYNNTDASGSKSYIPMGEVYDMYVPLPETPNEKFDAGTLFVTRAAVKFTFNVKQLNGDGLKLKAITVAGLADRQYLLPHNTTYVPAKGVPAVSNHPGAADPDLAGRFITAYDIPDDARHRPFTFTFGDGVELRMNTTETLSYPLYFCESKMGGSVGGSPYSLDIAVTDINGDNAYKFEGVQLPNLPILPRNTHVVVNITLTETDISLTVDVQPFASVELDPGFGLERDPINGYIILKKDSDGVGTFYYDDVNNEYYDKWFYPLLSNWSTQIARISNAEDLGMTGDIWLIKRANGKTDDIGDADARPSLFYNADNGIYYDNEGTPLNLVYRYKHLVTNLDTPLDELGIEPDSIGEVSRDFRFNNIVLLRGESDRVAVYYDFTDAQYKGAHNPLAVGDFRRLELKKDTNGWIEVKPYWYLDQTGDIDDCPPLFFNLYTERFYAPEYQDGYAAGKKPIALWCLHSPESRVEYYVNEPVVILRREDPADPESPVLHAYDRVNNRWIDGDGNIIPRPDYLYKSRLKEPL